jgi:hypothetical protein
VNAVTAAGLDLDAIEARASAAPCGPWRASGCDEGHSGRNDLSCYGVRDASGRALRPKEYATFAASARTDVPALIQEVRRLQARVAQAEVFRVDESTAIVKCGGAYDCSMNGRWIVEAYIGDDEEPSFLYVDGSWGPNPEAEDTHETAEAAFATLTASRAGGAP